MITFKINYRYHREGRRFVAGRSYVQAESHHDAREAFMATHPAGSNFRYEVTAVTHPHE